MGLPPLGWFYVTCEQVKWNRNNSCSGKGNQSLPDWLLCSPSSPAVLCVTQGCSRVLWGGTCHQQGSALVQKLSGCCPGRAQRCPQGEMALGDFGVWVGKVLDLFPALLSAEPAMRASQTLPFPDILITGQV